MNVWTSLTKQYTGNEFDLKWRVLWWQETKNLILNIGYSDETLSCIRSVYNTLERKYWI